MRVWFLVGHIFPPKAHGGGNLFNRKMYEALRSHGEEVEVVALPDFIDEFRRRWTLVQKLPFLGRERAGGEKLTTSMVSDYH